MSRNLKMEVFPSKMPVQATELYVYQLHSQKIDNAFSIIRGAAGRIRNYNNVGVFEDGKYIYTTEAVDEVVPNADFSIEYLGKKELPVLENRKVYSELIKYYISNRLSQIKIYGDYRKYSCKSSITSKWILSEGKYNTYTSSKKDISLERRYGIWVFILDDGKAYLQLDTSTDFVSNLSVYDYLLRGISIEGMILK